MLTKHATWLVPVVLLLGAVVGLYRKAVRLWWTYDDVWRLHLALVHSWTESLTNPELWPHHVFTPLVVLTHEALLALTGLDADAWYRVTLALIGACAVAVFAALRLYVGPLPSFAGAMLFISGPALCNFATQLMSLHYLEAILLGGLSVIAWVLALRRGSWWGNFGSAALYFAAVLAKEIVIPLPALLLFLPEREPRDRVKHLVLHGLALCASFFWRWRILGTLLGGYGWTVTPREFPRLLAMLPWNVILACAGGGIGVGLLALVLLSTGAASALRTRRAFLGGMVTLALAIAPIIPVAKEVQSRFVVMTWLWLCAAFAVGVASMPARVRNALIVVAMVVVVVANRQEWRREYGRSLRMSGEARAFMSLDDSDVLRRPAVPPAAMAELRWLKEQHFRGRPGSGWFYDDLYLCAASNVEGKQIYEWEPQRRQVIDVTASIPGQARRYCSSIRANAPMTAEFHHRDGSLFWRFGPYENGQWSVVLDHGLQAFPVPREDGFRLDGVPGLTLRVRYESPTGWVTYSPDIAIDFARQPNLVWRR